MYEVEKQKQIAEEIQCVGNNKFSNYLMSLEQFNITTNFLRKFSPNLYMHIGNSSQQVR